MQNIDSLGLQFRLQEIRMTLLIQSTELWGRIVDGGAIPNVAQKVKDVDIPSQILGDGAFPLRT